MIQRDFVLRQIQQLVQVLTRVLKLREDGQTTEMAAVLDTALVETLGVDAQALSSLPVDELHALCSEHGKLHPEKALVVAELLEVSLTDDEQDAEAVGGRRAAALSLYQALVASGEAVPFDIYDRIAALKTAA